MIGQIISGTHRMRVFLPIALVLSSSTFNGVGREIANGRQTTNICTGLTPEQEGFFQ
jgi:hypothetical protein